MLPLFLSSLIVKTLLINTKTTKIMFKLLNTFSLNGKNGYIYKRASCLYYSREDLGKEVEASNSLKPIPKETTLADFISSLDVYNLSTIEGINNLESDVNQMLNH